MDAESFKMFSREMADYIADYLENIRDRPVLPNVEPGYLRELLPDSAPEQPEKWQDLLKDVERFIMPGVTHWQSPRFHAYFPINNSYPAIVSDMLISGLNTSGFTWNASPVVTELEILMMDWLGKMLGLPQEFLHCSDGKGGGVIQGTASESTLVALLGAKSRAVRVAREDNPNAALCDYDIVKNLVGYTSCQAHSSVERAGLLGGVRLRLLPTDDRNRLRGDVLQDAIRRDRERGLTPFFVVATLGTTSSCAFDALEEVGIVCNKEGLWLHIDAAYAGSAFICPEFQFLMAGTEYGDSFNFNPHKWMLVNFDCSALWFKDPTDLINAFKINPLYLQHDREGATVEFRHWQIPFGRRFRALKLWFVLRLYGISNLQKHIRNQVSLAHEFENYVKSDSRFEIYGEVTLGLVCFRLKDSNQLNEKLNKCINGRRVIHLVSTQIQETYFLRFAICSRLTNSHDIKVSWDEICSAADEVLGGSQ